MNKPKDMNLSEIVEEFFARYTGEREGDFKEFISPSVVFDYKGPSILPLSGIHLGREELDKLIDQIQSVFDVQKYIIEKTMVDGNEVAIAGYATVKGRNTGRNANLHWGEFFTFSDGLIVEWRVVVDTISMLWAWGILQPDLENMKVATEMFNQLKKQEDCSSVLAEDISVIYHGPSTLSISGNRQGRAGFRELLEGFNSKVEIHEYNVEDIIPQGSKVVTYGNFLLSAKDRNEKVRVQWSIRLTISKGKVTHWSETIDTMTLAKLIGEA